MSKRKRTGEGGKKICADGVNCKFRNEYQHDLEFKHDESSTSSSSSSSFKWGQGRVLGGGGAGVGGIGGGDGGGGGIGGGSEQDKSKPNSTGAFSGKVLFLSLTSLSVLSISSI